MFPLLITPNAEMRLLEMHHAEEVFEAVDEDRDDLRQWLPWVDHSRSVEDTRTFLRSALGKYAAGNGFAAGIWCDSQIAGSVGLHCIDRRNLSTSIGYWLARRFRGRGLMTAACRRVLDYVFGDLQLHRVEIHCASGNLKSRAIPVRLGFAEEGIRRQAARLPQGYVDLVVYGMLATEWPQRRDDYQAPDASRP
jgi:ribosomal-protein-serine acetyltransferase